MPGSLCIGLGNVRNSSWRYGWQDLYNYKGVIHVPYHNGSMSIFEQYTANVPMFFPSKNYGKQLFYENKMFADLTFYRINKTQEPDDLENPNSLRNPKILDMWFDTCDFYDENNMKYIQYFDSTEHLNHLLNTVNTNEISKNMSVHNELRKQSVYNNWKEILTSIESQK